MVTTPRFETINGSELLAADTPAGTKYLDPRCIVERLSDRRVLIATTGGMRALDAVEAEMVKLLDLSPGAVVLVGGPL